MKLTGKITQIMPLQTGVSAQGNPWKKQPIVVEEDDPQVTFPNDMVVDLFNDRIPVTPLAIGQRVDVHFGIRTREYNGRIYNDINVLKLRILQA